jgi:DNA topoisomerase-1
MAAANSKQVPNNDSIPGPPDEALVYAEAAALTIRRRRAGRGWHYFDETGQRITDPAAVERLNRIALPPAYTEARFCSDPLGHLQAIGTDARGRRQYRYHPAFREARESTKFANCAAFGLALPALRRRLDQDLAAPPRRREAVLAAIVRILDCEYLRIGNQTYVRENKSFGLTTLRNRHAKLTRDSLALEYRGKGGIMRKVRLTDRMVIRIVRRCQDLPGQQLFQYEGEDGQVHAVNSADVNVYLREITGSDFSAKDFRTWHGSVIAFAALNRGAGLKEMLAEVSKALANTPAVARRAYIHPSLVAAAQSKTFVPRRLPRPGRLSREERGFLDWLAQGGAEPAASPAG